MRVLFKNNKRALKSAENRYFWYNPIKYIGNTWTHTGRDALWLSR